MRYPPAYQCVVGVCSRSPIPDPQPLVGADARAGRAGGALNADTATEAVVGVVERLGRTKYRP